MLDAGAIAVLLGSFFVMIFLGAHISYAMIGASIFTFLYLDMPPLMVISQLVDGIDGFTFLAIPFFILAGDIMAKGGISDRIVELADAAVGWMRGGLAMVNCCDSLLFGGVSGSATADCASLGPIVIPMMEKNGYDKDFATAITMTSSVEGMLIPPSHNMIIYSMAAGGLSVSALFMAGIVPGVLLAIAFMIYCYFISVKRNYPRGSAFSIKNLLKAVVTSIWGVGTILIVLVGVVTGFFTATESAAVAVIYAILVSIFLYREMKWKDLFPMMMNSIKTLSPILLLIAASGPFGYCIAYLNIPQMVVEGMLSLTQNKFLLLLLINIIILLLGMILGMASIIVIVTPILVPILNAIDVSLIQFGMILILNCGIGLITPPVGGVLFVGSGISGISIEKLTKAVLPLLGVMFIVLMMLTYIPQLSLWLPGQLGLL